MVREVAQEPCMVPLGNLKAYDNNAKKHTREQIDAIQASIREFGFRGFVIAWHNEAGEAEIVAGHARCKAAQQLGMDEVPVVFCDDLTDAQRRALTLADNQTTMMTGWDEDMLAYELDTLGGTFDMQEFGFDQQGIDFSDLSSMSEETEESREFEEKFKPKRTTDDCYTPPEVYDVIRDWACAEYGIDQAKVVRPFYPGGDYETFDYSGGKVVIDNPPFSILAKITRFYLDNGVPFFLFCPTLTALGPKDTAMRCCHLITGCPIVYENGAVVNTSFVTSYGGDVVARTCPELRSVVGDKVAALEREGMAEMPKYEYPDEVVTAAIMSRWAKYGVDFKVMREDCVPISELDAQKAEGKEIYGKGLLLSERAAAERAAAERAAAQRFELSDRERDLVASLGRPA